ncbi:LysR family transcriptional regulator [Clostridiaceae bacterium UIB06]|uniref:LysR family transcriptional regulator n=1 Tax=Clostridium thailandense TaxID=2794346 RepID=A0A949TZR2_9CLOT|nr:LysR family transcriptional regulator [Clostridium thailandense]MBV7276671.1 LysR family transcriptional regulator [Clostridium thailandense]MCH5137447.1 LysR family transcriptional regulator [Clostridiaceae bacterium UIB06]
MNLHGLRLFYIVAKTRSVTLAAEKLRISQPAITSQIKKFEKELGITLFLSQGRGIRLTEIGESLANEASVLFKVEDNIEALVKNYIQGKNGTLKIAANYLASNFLIPKYAACLKQQNENINIKITTMNTDAAVNHLINYEVDVAVTGCGAINYIDKVNLNKISEDELWFISAPNHQYANKNVSLTDIMLEPFVMREKGSYARVRLESICHTHGIRLPNIALEFDGLHEVLMAVMSGYGLNFCSSMAARELVDVKKLSRVYVDDVNLKNEIFICTRKNENTSPLVNNFISTIKHSS